MKPAQIIGFIFSVIGAWYLSLFYDDLMLGEPSSSSLGIGVAVVFSFFAVSALLLIPTSIILRTEKKRTKRQFTGWLWSSLFIINAIFAATYVLAFFLVLLRYV
ncbi:hypothetical protein [Shewanella donghaensis]|uniref:hypothetical protein n=1 Tax=Shewanella donghaensis TaxID=238836 RepID=UPI0011844418|nr:hypothetical protein [Shewanella donghaensis]